MRFGLFTLIFILFFQSAQAAVYRHEISNPPGNDSGGKMTYFMTQFNHDTNQFDFQMSIDYPMNSNDLVTHGWIAIDTGDGTLPDHTTQDVALIYMDFTNGDVFAYDYQFKAGQVTVPASNSPDHHIGTYRGAMDIVDDGTSLTVSWSQDVTDIQNYASNNPEWTGLAFETDIGLWGHFFKMQDFQSNADGLITVYEQPTPDMGQHTAYDVLSTSATQVSEPYGLALLGLPMIFFAMRRRLGFGAEPKQIPPYTTKQPKPRCP